jgi:hypothetical protein
MSSPARRCACVDSRALRSWAKYIRRYSTSYEELPAQNQEVSRNSRNHASRPESRRRTVATDTVRSSSGDVRFETIRGGLNIDQSSTITRREGAAFKKLQELATGSSKLQQHAAIKITLPDGRKIRTRTAPSQLDAILDAMKLEGGMARPIRSNKSRASSPNSAKKMAKAESDVSANGEGGPDLITERLGTLAAEGHDKGDDDVNPHGMSRSEVDWTRHQWKRQEFNLKKFVCGQIQLANSDVELWQILQTRVFARMKALGLNEGAPIFEGYPDPRMDPQAWRTLQKPNSDPLEIVGRHFLAELHIAADTLRRNFPTSLYQLALIPELRSMGPAYFALGASADLYNAALEHLVVQDENMAGALDLLNEMEREVIEPNRRSVEVLTRILEHQKAIEDGSYGQAVKMVWSTEQNENILRDIGMTAQKLLDNFRDPEYIAKHPSVKEKSGGADDTSDTSEA